MAFLQKLEKSWILKKNKGKNNSFTSHAHLPWAPLPFHPMYALGTAMCFAWHLWRTPCQLHSKGLQEYSTQETHKEKRLGRWKHDWHDFVENLGSLVFLWFSPVMFLCPKWYPLCCLCIILKSKGIELDNDGFHVNGIILSFHVKLQACFSNHLGKSAPLESPFWVNHNI